MPRCAVPGSPTRGGVALAALALLAASVAGPARAQTPPPGYAVGVRGVWITDVNDLLTPGTPRTRIAEAMEYLASRGFNVVFPVVWNDGYTVHPSAVMAETFGEGYRQAPGWGGRDPLAELVFEAHRVGLEVIPWFEFGFSSSYSQNGGHIVAAKPSWASKNAAGGLVVKNGFDWLDALNPEVQGFMSRLVLEVATAYDVDGVQGDDRLPAMPSEGGYTVAAKAAYAAEHGGAQPSTNRLDAEWLRWRSARLTRYLGGLYRGVKAVDGNLLVSMSPSPYPFGYEEYLQNSPAWLDSSYVDLIHPQLYRYDVASYKGLVQQTVGFTPNAPGGYVKVADRPKLAPGILLRAGTRYNGPEYAVEAVRFNRQYGITGEVFFYYQGLRETNRYVADSLYKYHYGTPAVLPGRTGLRRPAAAVQPETAAGVLAGPWAEACVVPNQPASCVKDGYAATSLQRAAAGSGATARYTFRPPAAATYDVWAWVPYRSINRPDATASARYTVSVGPASFAATVDQNAANPSGAGGGGRWVRLGSVAPGPDAAVAVALDADGAGDGKASYADAVLLLLDRKASPDVVVTDAARPDRPAAPAAGLALRVAPNPAAGTATLHLTLAAPAVVRVGLYDALGRSVGRVAPGALGAGAHALPLPLGGLVPGVYFARAEAAGRTATAAVVVR